MSSSLKHFFIPHSGNNYHPHALHHKRILFYGTFGIVVKIFAVTTALLLPAQAFVIPEVLVAEEKRVIELTNEVREREGVPPLVYASKLETSSLKKAEDMAVHHYFEHVSPQGKRLRDFLRDARYTYSVAGENLAVGFSTPEAMVTAWVESPTHFSNLIDPDFKDIGVGGSVGMYGGNPALYVAQHFGNPVVRSSQPRVRGIVESGVPSSDSGEYYDFSASYLSYRIVDQKIELHAQAYIIGEPQKVIVVAQGYVFELYNTHEDGVWSGILTIPESSEKFFAAVVPPEITITWSDTNITKSVIEWQYVPVVAMSKSDKYELARLAPQVLGTLSPATLGVLYGLIAFFSLALILKIVIQIRHQHYHVIASTLLLIGFLSLLIIV